MSYLEKLLEGVDAEWKTLSEIGEFTYGYAAKAQDSGDARFVRITDINVNGKLIPTDKKFVDVSGENERYLLKKNDLLMARTGATFGKTVIFEEDYPAIYAGFLIKLNFDKKIINPKYYWHFAQSNLFWDQAKKLVSGGGQPQFNANALKQVKIPIPFPDNLKRSLQVQVEIVKNLDKFDTLTTSITEELSKEMALRKMQYHFYLDDFFSIKNGGIESKRLNEIGEFQRGKRFVKTDLVSEGIPCIHYGEMYTHYGTWANESKSFLSKELVESKKLRVAERGDVVIVAAGETIEDIGKGTTWLGDEGVVIHDACFSYRSPLNPKYVAYFTRTKHFHDQIKKHISSGKISAINDKGLGKALIPVPSPEEQERIVTILDKFDILTSSISDDLPKEIKLRKRQNEYYRDKLLTFPIDNLNA